MKCVRGHEVKTMHCGAGYYLGTSDVEDMPYCRLTTKYARKAEDAASLPMDRIYAVENLYCSCGEGCFSNSVGGK